MKSHVALSRFNNDSSGLDLMIQESPQFKTIQYVRKGQLTACFDSTAILSKTTSMNQEIWLNVDSNYGSLRSQEWREWEKLKF